MSEKFSDFDEALKYQTLEAKYFTLDALACMFHNRGYELDRNTESSDVRWLADWIGRALDEGYRFELATPARQFELTRIAEASIAALPHLAGRISSRYISMAKALRAMEQVARKQRDAALAGKNI